MSHDNTVELLAELFSSNPIHSNKLRYNKRLGAYLHPRDMRRLISPITSSNQPQIIVRRHVILLNLYPIRTILLRDRILFLIPDGSDNQTFMEVQQNIKGNIDETKMMSSSFQVQDQITPDDLSYIDSDFSYESDSEWKDINSLKWINLAFELQAIDGILETVLAIITRDLECLSAETDVELEALSKKRPRSLVKRLRILKDKINSTEARVNGLIRTLNSVLDKDEDMALMNLNRLITHPNRFIQPVSEEVLVEESDEPELILESHLHDALSIANSLEFLRNQISNSEQQVSMKMSFIRNRLLFIDCLLNVSFLCLTIISVVTLAFNMSLTNHLEDNEHAFVEIIFGTLMATFVLFFTMTFHFYQALFKSSSSFF